MENLSTSRMRAATHPHSPFTDYYIQITTRFEASASSAELGRSAWRTASVHENSNLHIMRSDGFDSPRPNSIFSPNFFPQAPLHSRGYRHYRYFFRLTGFKTSLMRAIYLVLEHLETTADRRKSLRCDASPLSCVPLVRS